MKRLLVIFALVATGCSALAQGRLSFGNDSAHYVVMTSDSLLLLPGDAANAGAPYPGGVLPSGRSLVAGLYAGTSASSLTLQTVVPITGNLGPGRLQNLSFIMSGIPGSQIDYFQVAVWSGGYPNYAAARDDSGSWNYGGITPVFMGTPSSAITYPPMVGPAFNWEPGPITVELFRLVPEPSAFGLTLLGLGTLFLQRRRLSAG